MFGKKKQQALFNSADDSRSEAYFCLRSSHGYGDEAFRTVEYRLYSKLEEGEMIPRLDEHLNKLFAGEVDDANGDMLDAIIFGAAREALPDLSRQHYDHMDMLRRFIVKRQADRGDIQRIKEDRERERDNIQGEYDNICHLLSKCEEV